VIKWWKRLFESRSLRDLRASRKDLHDNRNEAQKSVSAARLSGKNSYAALKVAERALEMLEKRQKGLKQ
jgi:hypothetical protein